MDDGLIQIPDSPWPPMTLDKWLDMIAKRDPPLWYIDGILPADGVGVISGPPKSYKTFFAMMLARVAATGHDLPPSLIWTKDRAPMKVWFLEFEGSQGGNALAWNECEKGCAWPANYKNIYWMHRRWDFSLSDPAWVDRARDFVRQEGIQLIFVNTFGEACGTIKSEQDSQAIKAPLQALSQLQLETPRHEGFVFYVHHTRKGSGEEDNDTSEGIDSALRGSSGLAAGYLHHLAFRHTPDGEGLWLWTKSKQDEPRYYAVNWTIDKKEVFARLNMSEWKIRDPLELPDLESYMRELRSERVYTETDLKNLWRAPKPVVRSIAKQLRGAGMVEGTPKGWKRTGA